MKRLIVCMDGTWQNMAVTDPENITNIAKIARDIEPIARDERDETTKKEIQQIVHYSPGIGGESFLGATRNRFTRGATGEGAEEAIVSAYLFLSLNYQRGDEIYLFGFSRGAFCVRSVGGLIRACGLLRRDRAEQAGKAFDLYRQDDANNQALKDERAAFRKKNSFLIDDTAAPGEQERPPIAYIGVFDTVVMRGLPTLKGDSTASKKYGFHNLRLGDHVRSARHALAIDEERNTLRPTPWTNLDWLNQQSGFKHKDNPLHPDAPFQQKWFTGAHGDVGGGQSKELSEVSRKWIKRGAMLAGLSFTGEALDITPDPPPGDYKFYNGKIENFSGLFKVLNFLGLKARVAFPEIFEPSAELKPGEPKKPKTWAQELAAAADRLRGKGGRPTAADVERLVHVSAYMRAARVKKNKDDPWVVYNPKTLAPLLKALPKDPDRKALFDRLSDQMRYSDQILRVDRLRGDSERIS